MMDKNRSARILLDNLQTYIAMYREWGLEGVSVKLPAEVFVGATGQ